MNSSFYISTDKGENWLPVEASSLDSLSTIPLPEKEWTLLDKQENHLVFVEWESREWFVCDVEPQEAESLVIGKAYNMKLGKVNS